MYYKTSYSKNQLIILLVLRVMIGWHFLYEGMVKLINPDWTSAGFLLDSKGVFSSIFISMASNVDVLKVVDFFNVWGLILIGLGLILGLFTRISIIAGISLLAMYYFSHPPMVAHKFSVPSEGSYLWINKNLIELVALAVLLVFPTGRTIGLDRLIHKSK